jgi:hypothetical protein
MVDHLGTIRIGVKDPVTTPMPCESVGPVPHIPFVSVEDLGKKRFRFHFTPL